MAKITVVLTAVLDDGKEQRLPGETISMEEVQAKRLAALGMVKMPEDRKQKTEDRKKSGPSGGKKTDEPHLSSVLSPLPSEGGDDV